MGYKIQEGKAIVVPTAAGAVSGDAFVLGNYRPGVLVVDAGTASPYEAVVEFEGIFALEVEAVTGSGNSKVNWGDALFWTDKDTPLNKDGGQKMFGIALGEVTAGETAEIPVWLHPTYFRPASITATELAADAVITAKILNAAVTFLKLHADVTKFLEALITDPGDTGAIPVTGSGVCPMTSAEAGGETRTLAVPAFAGQRLVLTLEDDGGDVVVTVAAPVNQTGNNTLTFDTEGATIELVGTRVDGDLVWRVSANDGVGLTTVSE